MRLRYQQQSTEFTCEQTTAAIVMNSLLGSNYTDIGLIRAGYPFPLDISKLMHGLQVYGDEVKGLKYEDLQHLAVGLYDGLFQVKGMPTFEQAIDLARTRYVTELQKSIQAKINNPVKKNITPDGSYETPMTDDEIRQSVERITTLFGQDLEALERLLGDKNARDLFLATSTNMHKDLFEPIGYDFTSEDVDEVSVLNRLSENKIHGYSIPGKEVDEDSLARISETGIVKFTTPRRYLELPQFSQGTSHAWVIDRVEGRNVVILDVHHSVYDHGPEILKPTGLIVKAVSLSDASFNHYRIQS